MGNDLDLSNKLLANSKIIGITNLVKKFFKFCSM